LGIEYLYIKDDVTTCFADALFAEVSFLLGFVANSLLVVVEGTSNRAKSWDVSDIETGASMLLTAFTLVGTRIASTHILMSMASSARPFNQFLM
jgi:hypothetical protein